MTDKSAAAVREFIFQHLSSYDEWGYTFEKPGSVEALTALISKNYTANEDIEKMVSERLREELIAYDKWLCSPVNWGNKIPSPSQSVDEYLKSRGK